MNILEWFENKLIRIFSFKPKTKMNVLEWLENKHKCKYPTNASKIINFLIDNPDKQISFTFWNFGTFDVLNFLELDSIENGRKKPVNHEETRSNLYFLIEVFKNYFERYHQQLKVTKILPFARSNWGDKLMYIIFINESNYPTVINIDSTIFQPQTSKYDISRFVPIESLSNIDNLNILNFDNKINFSEIITSSQYFFDSPDGIWSVESYQKLIDKSFKIYNPLIDLEFTPLPKQGNMYQFNIKIAKFSKIYSLEIASNYVDSINLIFVLNDILNNIDDNSNKLFVSLSNICDFGIALVTIDEKEKLLENGFMDIAWR